jgi:hypothetical protein
MLFKFVIGGFQEEFIDNLDFRVGKPVKKAYFINKNINVLLDISDKPSTDVIEIRHGRVQ